MNRHIHKVNGTDGKTSLNVVLPHNMLEELKIKKGDFVEIRRDEIQIVIKKLESDPDSSLQDTVDGSNMVNKRRS